MPNPQFKVLTAQKSLSSFVPSSFFSQLADPNFSMQFPNAAWSSTDGELGDPAYFGPRPVQFRQHVVPLQQTSSGAQQSNPNPLIQFFVAPSSNPGEADQVEDAARILVSLNATNATPTSAIKEFPTPSVTDYKARQHLEALGVAVKKEPEGEWPNFNSDPKSRHLFPTEDVVRSFLFSGNDHSEDRPLQPMAATDQNLPHQSSTICRRSGTNPEGCKLAAC